MMRTRHTVRSTRFYSFALVILGCLLLVFLVACGGNAPAPTAAGARAAGNSSSRQDGGGGGPHAAYATVAAPAAPTQASAGASGAARPGGGPAPAGQPDASQPLNVQVPDVSKMVIKNGTLSLIVEDVDSAVNQVVGIALQHGGDVRQSTNNKSGDRRVADMVIQVESGQFDKAMRALREMAGVVERPTDKTDSQDVSEEYVDVQAQIMTLEATERQLRALLDQATRIEDILTLQREITTIRGQIDRLQGRANFLERRSAMSTITLHLETPPATQSEPRPQPVPVEEWRFSKVVSTSWAASLRVLQAVTTVVVSVVVFCWWLLPLALIGGIATRVIRRRADSRTPPAPPSPTPAPGD